jgi:sarcosine oxidase subunit alpha
MTVNDIPNVRTCITPLKNDNIIFEQDRVGELSDKKFKDRKRKKINTDITVVGSGPAGMMAAIASAKQGVPSILIVDENHIIGGQLVKQTHKFFGSKEERAGVRGIDIAVELLDEIKNHKTIKFMLETTVVGCYDRKKEHNLIAVKRLEDGDQLFEINSKKVIFACGAMENMLAFPGNDLPGVYGAGGVQTLMNVYGVKPGNKVVMVGAGNVGLIVSYQLLQANVKVNRVVEIMPKIGGYHVHAAKLRRCGVPIKTSHSIKEVYGKEKVEGVIVVKVDNKFQLIPGTEEKIPCDTLCIAVGLTPSIRLLEQMGVETEFIPEAGGYIAVHDSLMQTKIKGVYTAGDSSGIEEASTAMIEGELAGLSAAASLGYDKNAQKLKMKCKKALIGFRSGPFGEKPRICKEKIACCWDRGVNY